MCWWCALVLLGALLWIAYEVWSLWWRGENEEG
jgi:hypothetical protein